MNNDGLLPLVRIAGSLLIELIPKRELTFNENVDEIVNDGLIRLDAALELFYYNINFHDRLDQRYARSYMEPMVKVYV